MQSVHGELFRGNAQDLLAAILPTHSPLVFHVDDNLIG